MFVIVLIMVTGVGVGVISRGEFVLGFTVVIVMEGGSSSMSWAVDGGDVVVVVVAVRSSWIVMIVCVGITGSVTARGEEDKDDPLSELVSLLSQRSGPEETTSRLEPPLISTSLPVKMEFKKESASAWSQVGCILKERRE